MDTLPYKLQTIVPILRMFDVEKTKDFYLNYLEFKLDWEHQYEDNFPLYMQVSHGDCVIHLSEHHGDCCPGAALRIQAEHIEALHAKLVSKQYKYMKPGLETAPWGTKEIGVIDPAGNRLTLYENIARND
ncbi:glyoxalase superfamily protein [Paenibacillus sp. UNC451MF]|uniref:glyoxalase superfamily protein n=1 Tax=Paenibacillus sp. UNC451MF TaxID=1449063 RepID=UPI00049212AC|nr:glyoxalase superfamily protein [Paenibacillus sp. UNC451MF]